MAKNLSTLLEELRTRHQAAQSRLHEATQTFQQAQQAQIAAQAAFQKAQQELGLAQQQFHGWNVALASVQAEEAELQQQNTPANQSTLTPPAATPVVSAAPDATPEPSGQTDLVRDLLQQHPQGITATELWKAVQDRFKYRAYFYNVLKRLEKNEGLSCRRGKYAFRPSSQESREEVSTVH
jgi:hypothetical protein